MRIKTLYISLIAAVLVAGACSKLERKNPLDPKNPNSVRNQLILAELFVNDDVRSYYDYTTYTVEITDSLDSIYNYWPIDTVLDSSYVNVDSMKLDSTSVEVDSLIESLRYVLDSAYADSLVVHLDYCHCTP